MAETIQIPDLLDPHLMEFGVCGSLRTSNPKHLRALKAVTANTALVSDLSKDATQFVQLFGGLNVKNHLHVDVVVRPSDWRPKRGLTPVSEIQKTIGQFVGVKAKLMMRGEFILELSTLPQKSFLRSAMKVTKISGVKARTTSGQFALNSKGPLRRVGWSLFSRGFIGVTLDLARDAIIDASYLQDSKAMVLRTFRSVILGR